MQRQRCTLAKSGDDALSNKDDTLLAIDDAAEIGFKIVEMADRVRKMHPMMAGTKASWNFELDGVRYSVLVGVMSDDRKNG
jgi:hypothetical protein